RMGRRIERTRSGEDFCEGKGKAGEQGRREGVVRLAGRSPAVPGFMGVMRTPGRMGSVSRALLGIVLCGRLGMGPRAASAASFDFAEQV
ncbi:MAG: hypothetical protein COR54_19975, partial [Elusimicrobia bacterium CG22_combo_CG10-13_8_21_14_all_63_91]